MKKKSALPVRCICCIVCFFLFFFLLQFSFLDPLTGSIVLVRQNYLTVTTRKSVVFFILIFKKYNFFSFQHTHFVIIIIVVVCNGLKTVVKVIIRLSNITVCKNITLNNRILRHTVL